MTTQNTEHTPTPWYASDDGAGYSHIQSAAVNDDNYVARVDARDAQEQANAEYIVKAANAYPIAQKLANALQQIQELSDQQIVQHITKQALAEWENQS